VWAEWARLEDSLTPAETARTLIAGQVLAQNKQPDHFLGPGFPAKGRALLLGEEEKRGQVTFYCQLDSRKNSKGLSAIFLDETTQRCQCSSPHRKTDGTHLVLARAPAIVARSPDSTFSNFLDLAELFIANGCAPAMVASASSGGRRLCRKASPSPARHRH